MAWDEGKKDPESMLRDIVNVRWNGRRDGQMMVTSQGAIRSLSMVNALAATECSA